MAPKKYNQLYVAKWALPEDFNHFMTCLKNVNMNL